jgi:hypothetical protein
MAKQVVPATWIATDAIEARATTKNRRATNDLTQRGYHHFYLALRSLRSMFPPYSAFVVAF